MKKILHLFLLTFVTFSHGQVIYLKCEINLTPFTYKIDESTKTVFQNSTDKISVIRWEDTTIIGYHTFKYNLPFEYDKSMITFNRVNGNVDISYLKVPTETEVNNCNKTRKFGCDSYYLLQTQYGVCNRVNRLF